VTAASVSAGTDVSRHSDRKAVEWPSNRSGILVVSTA